MNPVRAAIFPILVAFLALSQPGVATAQTDIARTPHNLTPGGAGTFKETRPTGLCVFCHTPHNAKPQRALWNRDLPGITYQLYASTTLRAVLNQPTGSSRLCLSCHDGVLALGNLRKPPKGEPLKLGRMQGPRVLGTDLGDDHPISFVYDSALAATRPGLVDPGVLPSTIRLDASKQMQCTTCHDPHEHKRAKFLRMDNAHGALCTTCHRAAKWSGSAHATSRATWKGMGTSPWPQNAAATVAANACLNCHRSHGAGHGPRLLAQRAEPDNCNVCHDGSVALKNVAAEFGGGAKFSRHPVDGAQWVHEPQENPATMIRHVACQDCHNPHAANSMAAQPPLVSGRLQGVSGATPSGAPVAEATFEYQVCLKCHGYREPDTAGIVRAGATRVVSRKIDPGNQSYHPIAAPGRNARIVGLLGGYSPSSLIGCTDCHDNSDWTPAGLAPRGPHASRFAPILARNYYTDDPTPESPASYDLCYRCHDRNVLLRDQPGTFPHRSHVVDRQAPCAACHDAHGSQRNAHLIDFMVRDMTGKSVVAADRLGRLEYISTLPGKGSCYLTCHGAEHSPRSY